MPLSGSTTEQRIAVIDNKTVTVILVDDEREILETEALILEMNGYENVKTCSSGPAALRETGAHPNSIVLLDVTMPEMDGIEVLRRITEQYPEVTVIMLTGLNDAETAVACMKAGAFDYIVKPIDQARLITCVGKAIEHRMIIAETQRLRESVLNGTVTDPGAFSHIVTCNEKLLAIFRYIEAIAPTELPILLTGETGAGKELFARAVHNASGRSGEFVCVNTAGIDDTLFSDTLFGHEAGAFTGAQKERRGFIAKAEGGTLFLDEIGDMRPESQVKLLRLLQERTFYRLGSEQEERCGARIVAATNRSIDELQRSGSFRRDLFFRLKAHHIHIPPLRDRLDDLPLLLDRFLDHAAKEQGKAKPTAPPELLAILRNYDYPGNVRELQGMVFDAVGRHAGGVLSCSSFREATGLAAPKESFVTAPDEAVSLSFPVRLPTAKMLETALVEEALKRAGGNRKLAAEMIGMARQTFSNKCKELSGG